MCPSMTFGDEISRITKTTQFAMFAEGAGGGSWPNSAIIRIRRARKLSGDKLPSMPMEHHGRI